MKKFLGIRHLFLFLNFFFILNMTNLYAQENNSEKMLTIAAVVNDKIITVSDLNNRVNLFLSLSSVPQTEENIQNLKKQLIKVMIDEELQIQEASKNGITISPEEIKQAIADIDTSNNMPEGHLQGLLESNNISLKTVEKQLYANMAWVRFIVEAYGPSVTVSEKEVDAILKTLSKSIGQPQRRVSEIFLSIDSPAKEKEVLRIANDFVKDLRKGASFDAFARQFSEAPSATQGGDIGWIQKGQLKESLDEAISKLQKGMVSDPIQTKDGVYIFYVQDIEKVGESKQNLVDLKQVSINLFIDKSEEAFLEAQRNIDQIRKSSPTCENLETLAEKTNAHVESLLNIPENRLPIPIQNAIKDLPLNTPSQTIKTEDGVGFLIVCKRLETEAQEGALPDKETLQKKLTNQKLELIARRILKDLRRAAFIETRI